MAKEPKHDVAIDEIKALEDRRYRAMLAGDTAVLDELCSGDLIYTHSKADFDDKRSYLHKVGSRYFTYLEITHPADRILVVGSAALVTGRMTAKVSVAGTMCTSTIAILRSGCESVAPGSSLLTSRRRSSPADTRAPRSRRSALCSRNRREGQGPRPGLGTPGTYCQSFRPVRCMEAARSARGGSLIKASTGGTRRYLWLMAAGADTIAMCRRYSHRSVGSLEPRGPARRWRRL